MSKLSSRAALESFAAKWCDPKFGAPDAEPQRALLGDFLDLLDVPNSASRDCFPSHFTASVLITDAKLERVLLTHHRKLGEWLQLGGHVDGSFDFREAALREGLEESGLSDLEMLTEEPVDLDRHVIPARPQEPRHEHFDVRYIAMTRSPESIRISEESLDLRWFSVDEAYQYTRQWSMHRQFEKVKFLRTH